MPPFHLKFFKLKIAYYIKKYILSPRNVKEETLKNLVSSNFEYLLRSDAVIYSQL